MRFVALYQILYDKKTTSLICNTLDLRITLPKFTEANCHKL